MPRAERDWAALTPLEVLRRWPGDRRLMMLHSGRFHPRWSRYSYVAAPDRFYRFDQPPGEGKPFAELRDLLRDPQVIWIGYLGYELGHWIEKLPSRAARDRGWPVIWLAGCTSWSVHDAATGQWSHHGRPPQLLNKPVESQPFEAGPLTALLSQQDYESRVQQVIDYIAAGDVFQVNLSQRFTATCKGNPRQLYAQLAQTSPAWYGAHLEFDPRHTICSISPELFLEVDAQRRVVTRPIKGTRPANVPPEQLRDSAKDAAELHMIVDLLRNDLGRVCAYGSIRVDEPRTIETHPTVHHGVATISGTLHGPRDLVELLRATMPGGSITGAPKVRAMQIIDELEPVQRGPYCGAIGFLRGQQACLNIAIRTMMIENRTLDLHVGGGIVADSDPGDEYEETLVKAEAMRTALKAASSSRVQPFREAASG
ncbi:MAG: anthranilate synthase component I family protein [Phycisphaeraceae bacterium]|nr:anthranilate synthase component I family protein [Phycisphaeraceae bacterium]